MSVNKSIYSIIKAPIVTEKSSKMSVGRKYVFRVAKDANKIEIKRAIENVYNVKVLKLSSMIVKGKIKRIRGNQSGRTTSWKKAVITLKEGSEIKIT